MNSHPIPTWIVKCGRCDISQRFDALRNAESWRAKFHTYHGAEISEA